MTTAYQDGLNWGVATAISTPSFAQPFEGDNGAYVLTQDFMLDTTITPFTPLALNAAHPVFGTYVLTSESKPTMQPGGIAQWTRTYCKLPATRSDGGSISYHFISLSSSSSTVGGTTTFVPGRPRFTRTVNCRIQHDYFLVGSGGAYADPTLIPLILEQQYYIPLGNLNTNTGVFTPTYATGNPLQALTGLQQDFVSDAFTFTAGGTTYTSSQASVPSRTTYLGWMTAGTFIVAQASSVARWQGNYWDRSTTYILAQ